MKKPHTAALSKLLVTSVVVWAAATTVAQAQPRDVLPTHGAQVLETLSARVGGTSAIKATSAPESAASAARAAIRLARETTDTRYLGRAQALLARWWDQPDAPTELAVLQATVQQSRHEFAAAHAVLTSALEPVHDLGARAVLSDWGEMQGANRSHSQSYGEDLQRGRSPQSGETRPASEVVNRLFKRNPSHAQGWLTLATLERLAGRYPAALRACTQVMRAGAALHGAACQLETRSLQGAHEAARRGLEALRTQAADAQTQAWLLSLIAENEERAGRDASASAAYQTSLNLATDGYTAIALADLQLRMNLPAQTLQTLAHQPDSDAVLLRRAFALKLSNKPQWKTLAAQLQERFAAISQRADINPATHAREQALAHLWLSNDGEQALQAAQLNLTLQKEPFDWWLALRSAELAQQPQVAAQLRRDVAAQGLRDARLNIAATGAQP